MEAGETADAEAMVDVERTGDVASKVVLMTSTRPRLKGRRREKIRQR